jgi:chitinase
MLTWLTSFRLDGDGSVIVRHSLIQANLPLTLSLQLSDERADCEIPVDGTNGCINALRQVQVEKYPLVKLILSIGGAADSKTFDKITSNETHLERFVHTARMLVDDLGMNGVDIDWEHPSNEAQGQRYTNLLARLRDGMPSPLYLVTTAVPSGIWALRNMNLGEVSNYVDMINVMAYDFVGPFPGISESGHHAQLRNQKGEEDGSVAAKTSGEAATQFLLEQGVAREKIVLGVPLYGRSFLGATGPGQPFHGHGGQEGGIFEYQHLPITKRDEHAGSQDSDPDAITPCAEQFDSKLVAAWCVGPQTEEGGGFITYDNAMSVEAKARYVKEEGLGGMFYWHIGFDKPKGEGSLVDVGGNVLGVGQRKSSWCARYR